MKAVMDEYKKVMGRTCTHMHARTIDTMDGRVWYVPRSFKILFANNRKGDSCIYF